MSEIGHVNDGAKAVTDTSVALTTVRAIEAADIRPETVQGPFLGLGAGMGFAERDVAERLGIRNVTLVDKDKEVLDGFTGSYVASDIFKFIGNTSETYGMVTVFGLEYVLRDKEKWQNLWSGLTKITRPNSLVIVYPHVSGYAVPHHDFSIKSEGPLLIAQRTY